MFYQVGNTYVVLFKIKSAKILRICVICVQISELEDGLPGMLNPAGRSLRFRDE